MERTRVSEETGRFPTPQESVKRIESDGRRKSTDGASQGGVEDLSGGNDFADRSRGVRRWVGREADRVRAVRIRR